MEKMLVAVVEEMMKAALKEMAKGTNELMPNKPEPGFIARINQHISTALKENLDKKKEENSMYYDAEEMAAEILTEDFLREKDLSVFDRNFVAFNSNSVCCKVYPKYAPTTDKYDDKISESKFFKKAMRMAKMVDLLSLRLSILSRLGYVNVDLFLGQHKNFFDACRVAKDLERLAYVNHKLSLGKKMNEVEHYKKMLEYANAYDKEEVVWGIPNTPEIKEKAMRRIIQTLTETKEKFFGQDFDGNGLRLIELK